MPRFALALAVLAGLAVAIALGTSAGSGDAERPAPAPAGRDLVLRGPGGEAIATVTRRGSARSVLLRTTTLPAGATYELWFVDRPGSARRVSAGTWQPNADGVTDVRLTGAADPALGRLEVTRAGDAVLVSG